MSNTYCYEVDNFIRSDNTVLLANDSTNPVPLEEVKSFLKIYNDDQDVYLESLQKLAIQTIQDFTGIDITIKTYKSFLDGFPCNNSYKTITYCSSYNKQAYGLQIPMTPYVNNTLIVKYIDIEGIEQTADLNDWNIKRYDVRSKKYSYAIPKVDEATGLPKYPATLQQPDAVTLEYQAGITSDGANLPIDIKQAILCQMNWLREKYGDECGDCVDGSISFMVQPLMRAFIINPSYSYSRVG
jgi:hypothetical protein